MLNFFVDSHTILSTQRVHGTSAAWCFLGSMVQWYTGSGVPLPFPSPVKLLCCRCYLNFRRASDLHVPCYWCEMLQGMGYPSCSLKHMFFLFSDSRFVIRAIYLPSLFQPLPKWWTITRGTDKIWLENYISYANTVGFIYVTCPPSMNPVGAVLWWKA